MVIIERTKQTLQQVRSNWNKRLDALGLPRISRECQKLPKTFGEYLNYINAEQTKKTPDIKIEQSAETLNTGDGTPSIIGQILDQKIDLYMGEIIGAFNELKLLIETQSRQNETIIQKLGEIAPFLEYDRNTPVEVQSPTPAERRRAEPPEPTDHRRESLPDWVVQDLSYDFSPDAIKNMFERFKQYYYENDRILPDYNGVKIKLRQWLERAAENGEAVMSSRALAELENARIERARAENTRQNEEYQRYRAEVSTGAVSQQVNAGLDNILAKLVKKDEQN